MLVLSHPTQRLRTKLGFSSKAGSLLTMSHLSCPSHNQKPFSIKSSSLKGVAHSQPLHHSSLATGKAGLYLPQPGLWPSPGTRSCCATHCYPGQSQRSTFSTISEGGKLSSHHQKVEPPPGKTLHLGGTLTRVHNDWFFFSQYGSCHSGPLQVRWHDSYREQYSSLGEKL